MSGGNIQGVSVKLAKMTSYGA